MVKEATNPGFKAGIAQRSGTKRVGWVLAGAPPRKKDMRLNAVGGVVEGRKLRDRVTNMLVKAQPDNPDNPENGRVYVVFAEPDLSAVAGAPLLPVKNGASDLALAAQFVDKLPIGFLVYVLDTADPEQPVYGHMRPLIVSDVRAAALNDQAFRVVTKVMKRQFGLDESNSTSPRSTTSTRLTARDSNRS